MKTIQGSMVQDQLDQTWNNQPDLPEYLCMRGFEFEVYQMEPDGTVRTEDYRLPFKVNPQLSDPQIVGTIAQELLYLASR